jgi:serum/glucocorticoid-regulated kinase 2
MYQRILHDTIRFSDDVSHDARRLIAALLKRDPTKRLGANGADEIKQMPFFSGIDWKK